MPESFHSDPIAGITPPLSQTDHVSTQQGNPTSLSVQRRLALQQSFHDELAADALVRPMPDGDPPDPLDVLLMYCRRFYGSELAREKAVEVIRRQQAKGMETYGRPLNASTPIDWKEYLLEEQVDAAAYAKGLPGANRADSLRPSAPWQI